MTIKTPQYMNVMSTPDGIQQFTKTRPKREGLARKIGKNTIKKRFGINMDKAEDFTIMNITNQMLASETKAIENNPLKGVWAKRARQNQYMNVVPNKQKRSSRKSINTNRYLNVKPNSTQYLNVVPNNTTRSSIKSTQYLNVVPNNRKRSSRNPPSRKSRKSRNPSPRKSRNPSPRKSRIKNHIGGSV